MKLKDYLSMNSLTQKQFAELVGVDQTQISRYLRGGWPERKTAIAIMEVTGGAVTPEDFLEGVKTVAIPPVDEQTD